jgi:hypothetical protein
MRGAPATAIQALAGHADLTMMQRYMHLSPAPLDAAIRLLEIGRQAIKSVEMESPEEQHAETRGPESQPTPPVPLKAFMRAGTVRAEKTASRTHTATGVQWFADNRQTT